MTNPESTQAFSAVQIIENADGITVSGSVSGGIAHFISPLGPYAAEKTARPDGAVYTFVDQFNQRGSINVVTRGLNGRLVTVATSEYGLFKNATMFCQTQN